MIIYKERIMFLENEFLLPKGSVILSVKAQNDIACIWFGFDGLEHEEKETRTIVVINTGRFRPYNMKDLKFIDTIISKDGKYVEHFFEKIS